MSQVYSKQFDLKILREIFPYARKEVVDELYYASGGKMWIVARVLCENRKVREQSVQHL